MSDKVEAKAPKTIKAGRVDVNIEQLMSYTEQEAIDVLSIHGIAQTEIIRVWKEVNNKSKPNKVNLDK